MKVCFATYDYPGEMGGMSTWLRRLLPLLQMADIELEVHVMAIGGKPSKESTFFREHGIPIRWIPAHLRLQYAVRSFLRFLEESQPDIYVPSCVVPAYYAAGYARRAGISTVAVLHSDDPYYGGIVDEFVKGDPDFRASAVVPVSTFLDSQISSTAAELGVTVRRIAYGVPIPRRVAALSGSVFRLVYIGRLDERQKRVSDVANSLCAVTQSIPNLDAWIVGDGAARQAVEDIIREKGMGARVHLLGRVDNADIYDVLAQCHSLVLLSDYEGLPIVLLEAMATGVVPICLDIRSGIREAIEHGVNGLIVKDRAADFFAAVKGLQSDLPKWRELSLAARETARQRYSIEVSARQWVELLEDLNRRETARIDFRAPWKVRLPVIDPRLIIHIKPPWKQVLEKHVRSISPLYRMGKATIWGGRKIHHAAMRWRKKEQSWRRDTQSG
jgi:glycosyltransferase involved in cell wall biosynthesis